MRVEEAFIGSNIAQVVSLAPGRKGFADALAAAGVSVILEDDAAAEATPDAFDVVGPGQLRCARRGFPLAQQFVSLYLPMGHVKSTAPNDEAFLARFGASAKWLRGAA